MDVDEIRCKFRRGNNGDGRLESGSEKMEEQFQDDEEEGESERGSGAKIGGGGGVDITAAVGRFYGWPSSRIVRVSRASGGKDRHSKVLTSKGLRDRRVRLSVNTAIQFYDLQDRLGYDQPSKAVEWLLKAAASSISELPPITSPFPETPNQLSDEKRSSTGGSDQLVFDSADAEMDGGCGGGDPSFGQQFATKSSACSSASEASKGSGLSLSRSESRIKARERAKERVAEKEKEKENASMNNNNPISQTTSFTELLNGGGGAMHNNGSSPSNSSVLENPSSGATGGGTGTDSSFFLKSSRQWDYLCSGMLTPTPSGRGGEMQSHFNSPMFGLAAGDHQSELQQFSFVPDHLVQVVNGSNINANHHNGSSNEYNNLSFSISSSANSSGLAGFNRGTLQSNSSSPSLMPHMQRFSDGSPASFFSGVDNHHQFLARYDAGNNYGSRQSAHRGKGKN